MRTLVIAAIAFSLIAGQAFAQTAQVFVSSNGGDRMAAEAALEFQKAGDEKLAAFKIDPNTTRQKIDGFGASFLEAGLICINSLEPAAQEDVFRALFDPERGAGFTIMKTVIAGTDFMSAGPWYTYNDTPGDVEMKNFSIARDLGPNGLVTYIKRARKHGDFLLQAPMDYPPDWMLTNVEDRKKQDVDSKYFDALALYYLRYLQEYEKQGIHIDYLCLFNEPGIYTKIPYDKVRILLRDHVGPLLAKNGVKTRIQLGEGYTRENAAKNYPTVLDDPEARKYVANLPYHGYDKKNFDLMRRTRERYNLPIWMTEICHAYQAGTTKTMTLPNYDFRDGDFWAQQIFGDLEAGASAWLYWNMILDEKGGPWLVSPVHGNPDPNIQHAPVIINRRTKEVTYAGVYWYLAHFSKFVRPGSARIETKGQQDKVRCLAFKRPDGKIVAELANSNPKAVETSLAIGDRRLALELPGISITTCIWAEGESPK